MVLGGVHKDDTAALQRKAKDEANEGKRGGRETDNLGSYGNKSSCKHLFLFQMKTWTYPDPEREKK